jgi:type IV pilus assembly protein PilN
MRVTLNLATRPFTDLGPILKRLRIAMAVLAVLCVLFGVGLHLFDRQAEATRAREHSLDGRIALIRAERQNAEALMSQPDNAQLLKRAQALNKLFDQKAFSWTLAMEALETVLPAGVQVTSIEPIRDKEGHITVHLRVAGPRDRAVDLVRNLEQSRRFLQPRIVGENAESNNSPGQRMEPVGPSNRFDFDLMADYNPPTPEERLAAKQKTASASAPAPSGSAKPAPRLRGVPAFPQQPGRVPYTGPIQPTLRTKQAHGGLQ